MGHLDTRRTQASGKLIGGHTSRRGCMESHRYMFGHHTRRAHRQERYWIARVVREGCDPDEVDTEQEVVTWQRRLGKTYSSCYYRYRY